MKKSPVRRRLGREKQTIKLKEIMLDFIVKKLRGGVASWKTTLSGVASLLLGLSGLVSLLTSDTPVTMEVLGVHLSLISAGIGLLFSRDNTTRSEEVPK